MLCTVFAGVVTFAEGTSLADALAAAKGELYGMYTAASADYLRDCCDRAQAAFDSGADNGEAEALSAALDALVPLGEYPRSPLGGFSGITAADIASMSFIKGTASAADGFVTLSGEGELRYSNAVSGGICGASPFAVAADDCDGFVLKITADAPAVLDLVIGKRGSADDCVFTLSDIAVSQGERYYLFPFSRFGDIPLDGTLNYISLSFTGAGEVTFGDLHAARTQETAADAPVRQMTKLTGPAFSNDNYYKLYMHDDHSKVIEFVEDTGRGRYILSEPVDDKPSQEFRILKDPGSSRYRLVNLQYGTALCVNTTGTSPAPADKVPDMTDTNQEWTVSYNKTKGFTFTVSSVAKLSVSTDYRVRCTAPTATAKTFDVYEIPGDTWNLIWSEEFNDGKLDTSVWRTRTGKFRPDREPIYHRDGPENLYFEDRNDDGVTSGNLVIKTKVEDYEGIPATGAYVDTVGNLLFTYGRVEIRAQLPEGKNIWPAGWMMGTSTLGWAACGELDIIEMVGTGEEDNYKGDRSSIATIHCETDSGLGFTQGSNSSGKMLSDDLLSHAYHTYTVEWDSESVRWYWDDILYFAMPIDINMEQYSFLSNPMYIILNTSINGTKDNLLPPGTPDESYYYIDYIRYYKKGIEALPEQDAPVDETENFAFYEQSKEIENVLVNDSTGNKAIVSGQNRDVKVYDIPTGTLEGTYDIGLTDATWSAAATPDGSKYIFVEQGNSDNTAAENVGRIVVCDPSMKPVKVINGVYASAAECAITPDSRYLVVFGRPCSSPGRLTSKNVHVIDLTTYEEVVTDPYNTFARGLVMANDGRFLAIGCDGTAKLYGTDLNCIATLDNDILVSAASFSADNKLLATCNTNGIIRVWNAETGEQINTIDGIGNYDILSAALNEDGSRIVVGCSDFCSRIFDTASGRLLRRMPAGQSFVANVRYAPDFSFIAAACNDGRIRLYDTDGNIRAILKSNRGDTGYIDKFLFSADGKYIAAEIFVKQQSCIAFWKLPDGIAAAKADFSALEGIGYRDEAAYTAESFAAYSAALLKANAVKANPYSSQNAIDAAALALSEAELALVESETVKKGDFDGDGDITVTDALAALRIAAKLAPETEKDIIIGDTDNDGHVTVTDALAILRVAAKLADTL